MIDYKTYNKLIEYLDSDDLVKLRAYLESERQKYYLKNAKAALNSYLRRFNYFDYIDENRILLTDRTSLYILNSDELLPQYSRDNKIIFAKEHTLALLNLMESYEIREQSNVGVIRNVNSKAKQLFSEDKRVYHFFDKQAIDYSKKFLGEDLIYSICDDTPACLAESEKGKGLILGLR